MSSQPKDSRSNSTHSKQVDVHISKNKQELITLIKQNSVKISSLQDNLDNFDKSDSINYDVELSMLNERFSKFETLISPHIEIREKFIKSYLSSTAHKRSSLDELTSGTKNINKKSNDLTSSLISLTGTSSPKAPSVTVELNASVFFILSRLVSTLQSCEDNLKQLQSELQSSKFTQNRIRLLERENDELLKAQTMTGHSLHIDAEVALRLNYLRKIRRSNQELLGILSDSEVENELLVKDLTDLQQKAIKLVENLDNSATSDEVASDSHLVNDSESIKINGRSKSPQKNSIKRPHSPEPRINDSACKKSFVSTDESLERTAML